MNQTDFSVGLVVLGDQVSYSQIVSLLLEGGASCTSRTGTVQYSAVQYSTVKYSTVHSTGPPHKTPLHLAAASGNNNVMEMLVKRGANWKDKDDWGWTVLHEAAASGNKRGHSFLTDTLESDRPGVQWVCKESKGLINSADKLGRTPLLAGLMAGAGLEAVAELLAQGEDPAQEDEVGRGAPEAAILYCDNKVPNRFQYDNISRIVI